MRYTTRTRSLLGLDRWVGPLTAAVVLSGCDLTAPLPSGAEFLDPPAHYTAWWSMAESCSGLSRPFREIGWLVVPGDRFSNSDGANVVGIYRHRTSQIVLARESVLSGPVVRHEMLHALVRVRKGENPHPPEYFMERCGGFVSCNGNCSAGYDGPEGAPPVRVFVNPLEISIATDSVVSASNFGGLGYASIVVSARNPTSERIAVPVFSTAGSPSSIGFAVDVVAPTESLSRTLYDISYAPYARWFAAGETKRYVFDLYLPANRPLGIGTWSLTGAFSGSRMTQPVTFRVTP